MTLKEFDRNGNAEIRVSESEVNLLCNVLYEYCELHDPKDKRIHEIRAKLYIIYEILHNGSCFDETTMSIIRKIRNYEDHE